ncbi:cytidine deaminase-like isoform X2 [Sitophilus oryzae]|uniref:Cytidine deaminase n=1 Tax=Sitophilus oryzae TaxID=7048 RepID=A0A6J2XJ50_SITOR|nr:cytidine deaminase-like isoform X2 [Sitophilus oryzae]
MLFQIIESKYQSIIKQATEARENAYCPYSNFKVGSAVLCADGSVTAGCNIENSAFPVGICAERCAYSKAISQGKRQFEAVAVVASQKDHFTMPCGACRQFMSEFGNVDVFISRPGHEDVLVTNLNEILPFQFQTTDKTFE